MWFVNVVKLKVEPNQIIRLATQAATLDESFHLRVHLEWHVLFPHFRDVNVLDVILEWPPLAFPPIFPLQPSDGISYFLIKKAHSHCVFVFSMQEVLLSVSSISTQCIHF
jgi:hypothetical protein